MTPTARPEITEDSIEGALQRNDALRVLQLALASNGIVVYAATLTAILRDIEEGGYTMRLTTHEERLARNAKGESS
jgi:hypothetical protein